MLYEVITVSKSGEPVIGVIADPVTDVIYSAAKGLGAFIDGEVWKLDNKQLDSNKPLTLVCDRSFLDIPNFNDVMVGLEEMSNELGLHGTALIHQGGGAIV